MLTIEAQSVSKISGGSVQNVAGEHVNVLLKSMSFNQRQIDETYNYPNEGYLFTLEHPPWRRNIVKIVVDFNKNLVV